MKHTIISWDCSYRNFFHLIDSLILQDYNKVNFELIFVEQRSKEYADSYNHRLGLKSLWDRYNEVKDLINIQVVYLGDDPSIPYHLGKCNNVGIDLAKGEIISIMDGDQLVPQDFLKKIEDYFDKNGRSVINLYRHMADRPVDVTFDNWTKQKIDFDACLHVCPTKDITLPKKVDNKGPLISALKEDWKAIGGYDTHIIWSTGLSKLGLDVTTRLELLIGKDSVALPDCFSVHPWHPIGFSRKSINSFIMLSTQDKLVEWSKKKNEYSWENRKKYCEQLYRKNKKILDKIIYADTLKQPGEVYKRESKIVDKINEFIGSNLFRFEKIIKKLKYI